MTLLTKLILEKKCVLGEHVIIYLAYHYRYGIYASVDRLLVIRIFHSDTSYSNCDVSGVFGGQSEMFLEPWTAGGGAGPGVPGVRGSRRAAGACQPLCPGGHQVSLGTQRPQSTRQLQHHFRG